MPHSSASSLAAFVRLPLFWPSWFPPGSEHIKSLLPEGVGTCRLISLDCSPSPFLAHSYSSYRTQHKCPFLSRILCLCQPCRSTLPPASICISLCLQQSRYLSCDPVTDLQFLFIACVPHYLVRAGLTDVCFSLCRLHKPQSLARCGCCSPGEQISIWLI